MLNEDRNNGYDYQTIELDLGDVQDAPMTKLVIDGRTCIPTSVAGRQRSLLFGPQVKFEVQDAAGAWKAVPTTNTILPKPPEFERPFVLDLSKIWISESRKVRFTYLYKTYLDAILLDTSADVPVKLTELPLASADLQPHGFNAKSSLGELYEFVYGEPSRRPTTTCPATTRSSATSSRCSASIDDKFVIFGGGDELTLRFTPPSAVPANTNRRFLFLSDGYYKDLKQTIDAHRRAAAVRGDEQLPVRGDRALPGRRGAPGLPGRVEHALRGRGREPAGAGAAVEPDRRRRQAVDGRRGRGGVRSSRPSRTRPTSPHATCPTRPTRSTPTGCRSTSSTPGSVHARALRRPVGRAPRRRRRSRRRLRRGLPVDATTRGQRDDVEQRLLAHRPDDRRTARTTGR